MKKTIVLSLPVLGVALALGGFTHMQRAEAYPMMLADAGSGAKKGAAASHEGAATVKAVDASKGVVTLAHGPIASIKWPAMTMDFKLKDATLAQGIKAGDAVTFEFVESGGNYVVTRISPSGK